MANVIEEKSYAFSLRIIKLYQYLRKENNEIIDLLKQLLRSGTSIGANIQEGRGGQSTRDFIAKFSISYKEAKETKYWLRLLRDSGYLTSKLANSFIRDVEEILRIIVSILKSTKQNSKSG